jgi:hypothetical protein
MTKRSALLIAGGLTASLLAGMVGAVRQTTASRPAAARVVIVSPPSSAPATRLASEPGDASERGREGA